MLANFSGDQLKISPILTVRSNARGHTLIILAQCNNGKSKVISADKNSTAPLIITSEI